MEESVNRPPQPVITKGQKKGLSRLIRGFGTSGVLIIILIVAIAAAVFFYTKYQDSQDRLKHPDTIAKAETQSLVEKTGKLIELPTGEQPTVATVSDVSKLSNQTFFANAKNGDKVLIYSKAKKAILYRPSDDKVINVAPLNVNNKQ